MVPSDTVRPHSAVDRVNAMPADELETVLRQCVAVPRWAQDMVAARPFTDQESLLRHAAELTAGLSEDEIRLALADHPRIGDQPAADTRSADLSRQEQSGVDDQDAALADRLRAANIEYENRFGHIYLVFASGRGGEELLDDLLARLANDVPTEMSVVRTELGKIAQLRLARVIAV